MAVTLSTLKAMRERGEKIAVLTCYDASFARVLDTAGVEVLLVGDSLGMVVQGHASTLPVKLAEMTYHTRCVATGTERAFIVADLPFGSYQPSPERAFSAAARLTSPGSSAASSRCSPTSPTTAPSATCTAAPSTTSSWPRSPARYAAG